MSETRTRTGYYQQRIDSGAYMVTAVIYDTGGFSIDATLITATPEQAREAASLFPKSVGARATTLSGTDYYDRQVGDARYRDISGPYSSSPDYHHSWETGYVGISFHLTSNGVTGARNETALKRYRSFRKNAGKLGIPVVFEVRAFKTAFKNSIETEIDLETLLTEYAKAA